MLVSRTYRLPRIEAVFKLFLEMVRLNQEQARNPPAFLHSRIPAFPPYAVRVISDLSPAIAACAAANLAIGTRYGEQLT